MRFKFIAAESEDTGDLGWMDSRACGPYGPLQYAPGLAHDCLEHFGLSTVCDEIEAHGAMYWIRYEGGYGDALGREITLEGFSSEWINLYNALACGESLYPPKNTRSLDSNIESDIEQIILNGKRIIRNEFNDEDDFVDPIIERIEEVFAGHFRIGYRKAQKRYGRIGHCGALDLFEELTNGFERHKPVIEGTKLTVEVSIARKSVKFLERYE